MHPAAFFGSDPFGSDIRTFCVLVALVVTAVIVAGFVFLACVEQNFRSPSVGGQVRTVHQLGVSALWRLNRTLQRGAPRI